jgi:hypothetical protein
MAAISRLFSSASRSPILVFLFAGFLTEFFSELGAYYLGEEGFLSGLLLLIFFGFFSVNSVLKIIKSRKEALSFEAFLSHVLIVFSVLAIIHYGAFVNELKIDMRGKLFSEFPSLCQRPKSENLAFVCMRYETSSGFGLETYVFDPSQTMLLPAMEWQPNIKAFFNINNKSDADECRLGWSKRIGSNIQYISDRKCFDSRP